MDKITKFLLRLSASDLESMLFIIQKIKDLELLDLDIKKLKTNQELYRVRKGKIRIIFEKVGKTGKIIDINYRDKIYKNI